MNRIVVRTNGFCPPGARDEEEGCHEPARRAITHLYYGSKPALIVEADIEINATRTSVLPDAGALSREQLEALLAHEWGHVLGLDHSCGIRMTERDANTRVERDCSAENARQSIMYPDPLASGRQLLLEPTADAIRDLLARYGSPSFSGLLLWLVIGAIAIAGFVWLALSRRRSAHAVSP